MGSALGECRAKTTSGTVRGVRRNGVEAYLGVPYAAPPVGSLRFRKPVPPPAWAGVLDCTDHGPIPVQGAPGLADIVMSVAGRTQSEDCLSVNVWTPAADDGGRPVMLWIYGGGFMAGSGAAPWYDGARLADRDVVVVSFNYRVGILGFLHLGSMDPSYSDAGNAGLFDQVAVLMWIRENIAAFGGDPDRVTVAGQSAGGVSVACLLAMPAARGLFRRAIIQSGGAHAVHEASQAEGTARDVLAALAISPKRLDDLAHVPASRLIRVQSELARVLRTRQLQHPPDAFLRLAFQPVADGTTLPESMLDAISTAPSDVDLLVGSNVDETRYPAMMTEREVPSDGDLARHAALVFGDNAKRAIDIYRRRRPSASADDLLFAMATDQYFRIQAIRVAEKHPGRVFMYSFTLDGTGMATALGTGHAFEIPFVFDHLDAAGVDMLLGPVTQCGRQLAETMSSAWASFVYSGHPSGLGRPEWPQYRVETREVMKLAASPAVIADPCGAERALWDGSADGSDVAAGYRP